METIFAVPANKPVAQDRGRLNPPRSIDAAIRAQVDMASHGQLFVPADFTVLGSRAAVDKVLSRLVARGKLRRIARGLYDRPGMASGLPSAEVIAKALAGNDKLVLQPSGGYAVYLLGLTEAMPARLVFLTNGAPRTVWIGDRQIVLKTGTAKVMACAGRTSGLVIQALRHLKRSGVDERVMEQLRARFSREECASIFVADASFAPAWIAKIMRGIAKDLQSN